MKLPTIAVPVIRNNRLKVIEGLRVNLNQVTMSSPQCERDAKIQLDRNINNAKRLPTKVAQLAAMAAAQAAYFARLRICKSLP